VQGIQAEETGQMKPKKTWVIVANGQKLVPLQDRAWQAPEMPPFDDAQGHTNSSTSRSRHRYAPSTKPDKQQFEFATILSGALTAAFRAGEFEVLHLTAAPHMLGLLRPLIDEPVKACIAHEQPKDLTNLAPAEVLNHLGL
jgi:protein required for attachment to host cells